MAGLYHANFASADPRPTRGPATVAFGAADDTVAAAVASELGNWTTGQLTSLSKRVGGNGYDVADYPGGTRITLNSLVAAADGKVWRVRVRNAKDSVTDESRSNWLLGLADVDTGIAALASPPAIPGAFDVITRVASIASVMKT